MPHHTIGEGTGKITVIQNICLSLLKSCGLMRTAGTDECSAQVDQSTDTETGSIPCRSSRTSPSMDSQSWSSVGI